MQIKYWSSKTLKNAPLKLNVSAFALGQELFIMPERLNDLNFKGSLVYKLVENTFVKNCICVSNLLNILFLAMLISLFSILLICFFKVITLLNNEDERGIVSAFCVNAYVLSLKNLVIKVIMENGERSAREHYGNHEQFTIRYGLQYGLQRQYFGPEWTWQE